MLKKKKKKETCSFSKKNGAELADSALKNKKGVRKRPVLLDYDSKTPDLSHVFFTIISQLPPHWYVCCNTEEMRIVYRFSNSSAKLERIPGGCVGEHNFRSTKENLHSLIQGKRIGNNPSLTTVHPTLFSESEAMLHKCSQTLR